jgi:hypothetical protein
LSDYLFRRQQFRFPPQSEASFNITDYTLLPPVLDSHLGVCLGTSCVYLAIAQRLGLHLKVMTPPGHIYLSYEVGNKTYNIETTARGVRRNTGEYCNTESCWGTGFILLPERSVKEVVGLVFMNRASEHLASFNLYQAQRLYEKALHFMPHDSSLQGLHAIVSTLIGDAKTGKACLVRLLKDDHSLMGITRMLVEDFITGKINSQGLKEFFLYMNSQQNLLDVRSSFRVLEARYPGCNAVKLELAILNISLGSLAQAEHILHFFDRVDQRDPLIYYYLTIVAFSRFKYAQAWRCFNKLEKLLNERGGVIPHSVRQLKGQLLQASPCPDIVG